MEERTGDKIGFRYYGFTWDELVIMAQGLIMIDLAHSEKKRRGQKILEAEEQTWVESKELLNKLSKIIEQMQ